MPRNSKEINKYDNNGSTTTTTTTTTRRTQTFMSAEDLASGKKSLWTEMEITGTIRNLSPNLFKLSHLTALYLKNNMLSRISPEISQLANLRTLDLSNNKLRSLPAEIGDLINLRELQLSPTIIYAYRAVRARQAVQSDRPRLARESAEQGLSLHQ